MKDLPERARKFSRPCRVGKGKGFRLRDVDPGDTAFPESADVGSAKDALQEGIEQRAGYQDMLYAQDRWSLLLIFQAMDPAAIVDALPELRLHCPELSEAQRRGPAAARRELTGSGR